MKKAIVFLSVLTLLAGCRKKVTDPPVAPAPQKTFPKNTSEQLPRAEQADPRSRILASMKRTGCFGRCPVWSATVWSDGRAEFIGEKWAKRQGRFTATVRKTWLKELLEGAESSGYFALAPYYPTGHAEIADLPATFLFIESRGRMHQIENHFDAPPALRSFEAFFEQKLEELDWKNN